jgi:hypothetical protein
LKILNENDFVVDWLDFFKTGLSVGWTYETIFRKIEEGFVDNEMEYEPVKKLLTKWL